MALSAADKLRLTNLRAARDQLISGQATAAVEYNGQRNEFAKADMQRLDAAIEDLLIEAAKPATTVPRRKRGAIRFLL